MRLNKFLSEAGIASRRKSDVIVKTGKIIVNGNVVYEPWLNIEPEKDKIEYDGKNVSYNEKKIYIMLNKPAGYITTVSDEKNRETVLSLIPVKEKIFPMGRLDKDSTGLLLLTNDGDLAYKLTHPKFCSVKKYEVEVNEPLDASILQKMENGIWISKKEKVKAKGRILNIGNGDNVVELQIFEGRKRQIRRMFSEFNYEVVKLKRIQFGSLRIGVMKEGEWRYLDEYEVKKLRESVKNESDN